MSAEKVDLANLDSFGDVAAEDDAVLDYFLATDAVRRISNNEVFLILGRKGSGKTAIVRHFTESGCRHASRSINLRGYPWNVHASRVDHGASEVEAYVASWRYLIAVELASLVYGISGDDEHPQANAIRKFFNDNYGDVQPLLGDVLRPARLKLGKVSINPSIMGNALGGVALDREGKDPKFGRELEAVSAALLEAALDVAESTSLGPLSLHFDELDQGLSQLDKQWSRMVIGLILAAREVRRQCQRRKLEVNPVVYLRTDLWDELEFSDKNKISQTQALHLAWDSQSLQEVVEARLRARLGESANWAAITTEDLMRGSQTKWNHILARTFLRPRDVIRFLNAALDAAKVRASEGIVFENKDIVDAREKYSSYLKEELDDEVLPHWRQWEEALRACSGIATITFSREQFEAEYESRKSVNNENSADDALQILFGFSVFGYERRSGYGGSSWAFQYTDPEAGWDSSATRFKVHLGLKEYAKLREERKL